MEQLLRVPFDYFVPYSMINHYAACIARSAVPESNHACVLSNSDFYRFLQCKMEFYNLSHGQIGDLMDCIKAVRLEQEDNLLIWEKKGQFGQGFCMVGENGWNEISAENISMDDWCHC